MQTLDSLRAETKKLTAAINAAYKEMVEEKMLHDREIVTADKNGNVRIEKARDYYERVYK